MLRSTRTAVAILAICLSFAACSGGTEPSGPNVAGLWTGEFRSGSVSLDLDQSGTQVSGTITRGAEVLDVAGEVESDGTMSWASHVHPTNCSYYGTPEMQLRASGDSLVGVVQRRSGAKVCDPEASGVVLVQQGEMRLSRVSAP